MGNGAWLFVSEYQRYFSVSCESLLFIKIIYTLPVEIICSLVVSAIPKVS